jgi:uncharacterized protein (DUF433 family)
MTTDVKPPDAPGSSPTPSEGNWIQKTPGVCGGRARISNTRIPIWSLVVARRLGATDEALLDYFEVPLTAADVQAAWGYYQQHREEIDSDIRQNEEA